MYTRVKMRAIIGTIMFSKKNIVKLRQGSVKDRQGMAVKAKGLKA